MRRNFRATFFAMLNPPYLLDLLLIIKNLSLKLFHCRDHSHKILFAILSMNIDI